jgi:hypothetical protein
MWEPEQRIEPIRLNSGFTWRHSVEISIPIANITDTPSACTPTLPAICCAPILQNRGNMAQMTQVPTTLVKWMT